MDVNAENEQLADLHVDLCAGEGDLACESYLCGYIFAGFDGVVDQLFEKGCLSESVSIIPVLHY